MSDVSEEWIAQSLARLEQAELERDQYETALEAVTDSTALRTHSEAIEALDAEIKALYVQLEAAADDDGEADPSRSEHVETSEFRPTPAARAPPPTPMRPPTPAPVLDDYDPFGPPASVPAQPTVAAAAGPGPGPGLTPSLSPSLDPGFGQNFDSTPASYDDFEDSSGGGAMKWVVLTVLVVGGGGVGAYLYGKQAPDTPTPAQPAAEAAVISASPVPPDTQGPTVAKGGDVDRVQSTSIRPRARHGRSRGRSQGRKRASKSTGRDINIENSNDPLAGLAK